jgi:hypothetical protein
MHFRDKNTLKNNSYYSQIPQNRLDLIVITSHNLIFNLNKIKNQVKRF